MKRSWHRVGVALAALAVLGASLVGCSQIGSRIPSLGGAKDSSNKVADAYFDEHFGTTIAKNMSALIAKQGATAQGSKGGGYSVSSSTVYRGRFVVVQYKVDTTPDTYDTTVEIVVDPLAGRVIGAAETKPATGKSTQ